MVLCCMLVIPKTTKDLQTIKNIIMLNILELTFERITFLVVVLS